MNGTRDSKRYVPDRGDLIWLSFDPQAGREQAGRRPALVLSPVSYNRRAGLAVACPITNQIKGYPFEVALPGGLAVTGAVLTDHVRSVDWGIRRATFAGRATRDVIDAVLAHIAALIELE